MLAKSITSRKLPKFSLKSSHLMLRARKLTKMKLKRVWLSRKDSQFLVKKPSRPTSKKRLTMPTQVTRLLTMELLLIKRSKRKEVRKRLPKPRVSILRN